MSFEIFRDLNTFIPLLAFGGLMFRIVTAWPADWAKPHHQNHYRALLLIVALYVLLSSVGAIVHEALGTRATPISAAYFVQSLVVIVFVVLWPKRVGGRA